MTQCCSTTTNLQSSSAMHCILCLSADNHKLSYVVDFICFQRFWMSYCCLYDIMSVVVAVVVVHWHY